MAHAQTEAEAEQARHARKNLRQDFWPLSAWEAEIADEAARVPDLAAIRERLQTASAAAEQAQGQAEAADARLADTHTAILDARRRLDDLRSVEDESIRAALLADRPTPSATAYQGRVSAVEAEIRSAERVRVAAERIAREHQEAATVAETARLTLAKQEATARLIAAIAHGRAEAIRIARLMDSELAPASDEFIEAFCAVRDLGAFDVRQPVGDATDAGMKRPELELIKFWNVLQARQ